MTLLGGNGLRHLAALNHAHAVQLAERLSSLKGVSLLTPAFFNEFALQLPKPAAQVVDALADNNVLGGVPVSRLLPDAGLDNLLLVAATETNSEADMDAYKTALKAVLA